MPAVLNWLLRLIITNPIAVRLVSNGSKRTRHLLIRSGYLAAITITLLAALLGQQGVDLREMASAGAKAFQFVAYLQLGMICLLAPVFMAGAIAQEANPRTWDILLTTPLNSLQIVLGNLFGRLFFILAMLVSSLPLFAVTQYFGGVPGRSIFLSYAIGAAAAILVGAIAIALSVSRQAGRRAVFLFYITVVIYIAVTWSLDFSFRGSAGETTWVTPLNPFLAQRVLLDSENYHPYAAADLIGRGWLYRAWFGSPVAMYCWLCGLLSLALIGWSTIFLRVIGARQGGSSIFKRLQRFGARRARIAGTRDVWQNPIAWREASGKRNTMGAIIARYGFIGLGLIIAIGAICLYHFGQMSLVALRQAALTIISTEVAIITLTAINVSATAISREREDGTLDILLTTPITPAYYVSGKLRGIVSFMIPMMAVPIATLLIFALYVLVGGVGAVGGVTVSVTANTMSRSVPFILPEGALLLPFTLVPFIAFCVMVGLSWSLKSRGTIGSVIAAVGVIVAVVGMLSLCTYQAGKGVSVIGPVFSSLSPASAILSIVYPEVGMTDALADDISSARIALVVGSAIATVAYAAVVYAIHRAMLGPNGRTFDMTVRRLAGTN